MIHSCLNYHLPFDVLWFLCDFNLRKITFINLGPDITVNFKIFSWTFLLISCTFLIENMTQMRCVYSMSCMTLYSSKNGQLGNKLGRLKGFRNGSCIYINIQFLTVTIITLFCLWKCLLQTEWKMHARKGDKCTVLLLMKLKSTFHIEKRKKIRLNNFMFLCVGTNFVELRMT